MTGKTCVLLLAFGVHFMGLSAAVQGEGEPRLAEYNLGTHWFGAKTSIEDLRGKVVLIETWGS